jgi:PTS system galactitol-specific IIA component
MAEVALSTSLIALAIDEAKKEAVLQILADKLNAGGYVRDGFYEAVLHREKEYPTGLPSVIPVALCHTKAEYVIQNAMAVGTLSQPVSFSEMGNPEHHIQAEIVFLLALKNPNNQIRYLNKLVSILKDQTALETIRDARNEAELATFLNNCF